MATTPEPVSRPAERDLVITRVFDAPRALVWQAWTEPERLRQWWGPRDFTAPAATTDLRVGGRYLWCMRGPDGRDYWTTGVFREIVPQERLVYTDAFADAHGNVVPASQYGIPGEWPAETLVTVTLQETLGKTTMTLRHAGLPAGEVREGTGSGWNESFDKLARSLRTARVVTLASERGLVMRRVFRAPRSRIFEAHSRPEHIRNWWGPRRHHMTACEMDFRPGGKWRFVLRGADGREYAFRGEYLEITPPERIVWTFEFEGAPGEVMTETLTLEERDGHTTLTATSEFPSAAARDGMLSSGMESGAIETWDRLAEYLERAQAAASTVDSGAGQSST
jgi:uncharacterized protein YndB with AHSA1/START domain